MRIRLLATILLALLTTGTATATTFTLSSLDDDLDAGTLRRAITDANADNSATSSSPHIIDATGISGTITLQSELPWIMNHVSIYGPGASALTIARGGGGDYSVFTIYTATTVVMADLTITNGYNSTGGGIDNKRGLLTLNDCVLTANEAWAHAGAINNDNGTLAINDCVISANISRLLAGGIYSGGPMTMTRSTLIGNSATEAHGGGIMNSNEMTITSSTISGSYSGGFGGGIYNSGTLVMINSTLSGNSAVEDGGGIITETGTVTLTSSTLADNSTEAAGGGIYMRSGTVSPFNTIIAGNTDGGGAPDIHGAVSSLGHNIIGNTADNSGWVSSDLQNVDPDLGPLQDNGGPTETMALGCGSPAIDAGDNTGAPETDQRGEPRVVDDGCNSTPTIDIGAYELQSAPTIVLVSSAIELSPVNHDYRTINVTDLVTDVTTACTTYAVSDVVITTVTSDEPEDASGGGDGNTIDDIVIASDCRSVELRAERSGSGDGRVYRIHLSIADDCGNVGVAEFAVSVRRGSGAAVEGSAVYTVNSSCSAAPKRVVPKSDSPEGPSLSLNGGSTR